MDTNRDWIVRDGNEKDLEAILALRKIVFGEEEQDKLDPRFWKWQFQNCPDGKAYIYIVEDNNKIIGHFADIPRWFSVQGKKVMSTSSVDLMVHPSYWGKGIFHAMASYAVQHVKQKNGLFMLGFPIRIASIKGLKKIGWKEVVRLPVLVYPIRFSGILSRYFHLRIVNLFLGNIMDLLYSLFLIFKRKSEQEGTAIEKIGILDESFDRFWETASSLYSIMGIRNRNFLNWRYLLHPTRSYTIYRAKKNGEMKGYVVLRKVSLMKFNSSVMVDLLALDQKTFLALVKRAIQHTREEGSDLLGFMLPKRHVYYRALKKMGFLPSFKSFRIIIYPQLHKEILFDPESWYVNWGDNDVI